MDFAQSFERVLSGEVQGDIVCGDCLEVMAAMPNGCCDLIFADPPYNKGKADWDRGHDWHTWVAEAVRVLKFNGALWIIHDDPDELLDMSRFVMATGRLPRINWITWDKYNGATPSIQWRMNRTKLHPQGKRSFDRDAEYLIYHADDGQWQAQCDKQQGFIFEPLRAYLDDERERAGFSDKEMRHWLGVSLKGGGLLAHYWGRSQWVLPTEEHYYKLRKLFNHGGGEYLCREYKDLRREYEGLCRKYENLRPTFNNPGKVSSVWQGPPGKCDWHPTPKPKWLLERIISTTSNEGDLVADFFMGSGTTAVAAAGLGRNFFGCDTSKEYVKMALERIEKEQAQHLLF